MHAFQIEDPIYLLYAIDCYRESLILKKEGLVNIWL